VRDPRRRPLLVLVTDGRANAATGTPRHADPDPVAVALAHAAGLAGRGIAAVVVDTEDGPVRLGIPAVLARALGAPCVRLDQLAAQPLAGVVRHVAGAAAPAWRRGGPGRSVA
jgi:magnesium chelatase subunit D